MESLFLIPGLGAPTGLEWLQLDHVLNVRGCICGRCVGKGAEVLWVIWAFIWYIGFRNKHSSSVFYWFGHISGFDPKKTRTQNLGIKWIYRYTHPVSSSSLWATVKEKHQMSNIEGSKMAQDNETLSAKKDNFHVCAKHCNTIGPLPPKKKTKSSQFS